MRRLPAFLLALSMAAAPACAQLYEIRDLGTLPDAGGVAFTSGINEAGQVVGRVNARVNLVQFESHAFRWDPLTGMQDLGRLPGPSEGSGYSNAFAVNNSGDVVGVSRFAVTPQGEFHPFLWSEGAGMTDLGVLGPDNSLSVGAYGINALRQVVGNTNSPGGLRAFLWDAAGGMADLGVLPGYDRSRAADINNAGRVVGSVSVGGASPQAFVWDSGSGMAALGFLPGDLESTALAITESGLVLGISGQGEARRGFIWESGGVGMTPIEDIESSTGITPDDINDHRQVVGNVVIGGIPRAFLWQQSTGTVDLNTLLVNGAGWDLRQATGINNSGQIAGWGINPQGQQRPFLLMPIIVAPEPAAGILFVTGLLPALGVLIRRRRKR